MLRSAPQLFPALRWAWVGSGSAQQLGQAAGFATAAVPHTRVTGEVPPGHLASDLSSAACHIGLGRRRDLTLRQDLCLWKDGSKQTLADVFKVGRAQTA
jgi:hypothetical protein